MVVATATAEGASSGMGDEGRAVIEGRASGCGKDVVDSVASNKGGKEIGGAGGAAVGAGGSGFDNLRCSSGGSEMGPVSGERGSFLLLFNDSKLGKKRMLCSRGGPSLCGRVGMISNSLM